MELDAWLVGPEFEDTAALSKADAHLSSMDLFTASNWIESIVRPAFGKKARPSRRLDQNGKRVITKVVAGTGFEPLFIRYPCDAE